MSASRIPKSLRERVSEQAQFRCGYCLTPEEIIGAPLEIDHLLPESLGGLTEEWNLWLACSFCNDYKSNRTAAPDPLSGAMVSLFNPRLQAWGEHFRWTATGESILGLTPTGRATIFALKLNRPALVRSRRLWVIAGWHPPVDFGSPR